MPPLSHRIDGNVAIITIDNPPQNRYTQELFDELAQALVAIGNSDARAIVARRGTGLQLRRRQYPVAENAGA
jgi:enoyl-CoA hydratase/carnithine racemase